MQPEKKSFPKDSEKNASDKNFKNKKLNNDLQLIDIIIKRPLMTN